MKTPAPALLSFLVWIPLAAACGEPPVPCTGPGDCPVVADLYQVDNQNATGECAFTPFLPATPTLIQQSEDGREASTVIYDQVQLKEITLSGQVYKPRPNDPPGTQGSVEAQTEVTRLDPAADRVLTLRVLFTASISHTNDAGAACNAGDAGCRRRLAATLITTEKRGQGGPPCQATISYTGTGSAL
ncbi:MAG: hypothetical protein D6729_17215 [Deltaproteobacteria bacterium]|nr:MAG: hypothetical protein D6729_17215 [Deltaproteobacteria bacterium]